MVNYEMEKICISKIYEFYIKFNLIIISIEYIYIYLPPYAKGYKFPLC